MKVYEVWEGCINLLGEYPEGLDEDSIIDKFCSSIFDPVYIDAFENIESAQKCAQKVDRPVRYNGYVSVCYRYIEELEYEDETDCPTENGVVDVFTYNLEKISA